MRVQRELSRVKNGGSENLCGGVGGRRGDKAGQTKLTRQILIGPLLKAPKLGMRPQNWPELPGDIACRKTAGPTPRGSKATGPLHAGLALEKFTAVVPARGERQNVAQVPIFR